MSTARAFTFAELSEIALATARANASCMNAMEFIAAWEHAGPNTRQALADVKRSTDAMVEIARIMAELAKAPPPAAPAPANDGE